MSGTSSQHRARLIFDPIELRYDFGAQHPFQQDNRLKALFDLLELCNIWRTVDAQMSLPLRAATMEELQLAHSPEYIAAVQRLSSPLPAEASAGEREARGQLTLRYGFGDGDTPALPGMHEIAAHAAGGTLVALSAVMGLAEGGKFASEEQRPLHVFHPGGGFHHAWEERASGFCVYNDIAVAIAHVLQSSEAKVLYLDFDAHHGDGVQRAFYDDPRVMTVSLHETGRYLFPGTGDVLEVGNGSGRGYSVNVPLEAFTEDGSYIDVMNSLLSPLVASFAPDVIISQHGCDAHAWDPLTHLSLTMRGIQAPMQAVHELAHTYCQGRWVAVGGGGYDLFRVVPRAWSMLWAEMSEQRLPEALPEAWIKRWQPAWEATQKEELAAQQVMGKSSVPSSFPTTFLDKIEDFPQQPRRWEISRTNRHTVALVRHLFMSSYMRQAFPVERRRTSPLADLFDLLHMNRETGPSRIRMLDTKKGPVFLRDFCPPSFVERLRPDSELRAFARLPEREHQLLLGIARSPDCALTLGYTPSGEIIGEVTIAPADEWWEGIENLYEVAIEVSSNWRSLGIASKMLAFALELDALEDMILFAVGLSWHWDFEGLGLSIYRYRELISRLFSSQGFKEYPTTEPNVSMEPANVFLARIGNRVDQRTANQFLNRVLSAPNLARL
ncbi:hypothetical protein EPA93_20100 [Ktedonosporobacter rubrisoli]|uniref:Acetoin utilization protein AcuC n=1 Tax=Ktedonosporobacter rubrisoli TaxID=2509675 RepID=A0A4P6JS27_KTERU|nr:acetoin utilization protein AcuC [Ktedonosporobacter rubrisoli]QBD78174.1 hypothetical protein EPA93_20100 [Ktedonosporobacter rubrisoli]